MPDVNEKLELPCDMVVAFFGVGSNSGGSPDPADSDTARKKTE